ncbi:hypothetical protein UFOVP328_332 [uncultured Caudovirales phage]|uniref:Uncharacterized protein n=1 Tax=uncultured Caudovirales phage TaxID=2100421 RepID=A0A6J5M2E7_9CAUD|nr:hypothetical protein UFOVP328_332 [uncultured Caudovirales phage]
MAQFTRTNGDLKPVVVMDQGVANVSTGAGWSSGANALVSGATVNPAGPKLDFFTVTLANIAANTTIANQAIQAIQQTATIAIYEFTDTGTDTLALALYPTGAYDTTTLATAVDTATGGTSSVAASATFTN